MPLIKGIDQPVRDFLSDLPRAASAGISMVSDLRGIPDQPSNKRYAYVALPESSNGFGLYKVDLETRAITPCVAPPAAAGGAYNTAIMAALYDPTGGAANNVPTVYVMVALTAAPWVQWMSYTCRTDVWAVLAAPVIGGAALNTSIALAHTCGTMGNFVVLNANIAEDHIYAFGNAGLWNGVAGPSNLAQYNKGANAWVYLLGAGGARAFAPAAGAKMVWSPTYPDALLTSQGGASTAFYGYDFATDAWGAGIGTVPAIPLGIGTELITLYEAPGWVAVRPGGLSNQVLAFEMGGGAVLQAVATIDDSVLPAAHESNALIAWWIAGGYYFGAIPYGRSVIKRIQVPMPL